MRKRSVASSIDTDCFLCQCFADVNDLKTETQVIWYDVPYAKENYSAKMATTKAFCTLFVMRQWINLNYYLNNLLALGTQQNVTLYCTPCGIAVARLIRFYQEVKKFYIVYNLSAHFQLQLMSPASIFLHSLLSLSFLPHHFLTFSVLELFAHCFRLHTHIFFFQFAHFSSLLSSW